MSADTTPTTPYENIQTPVTDAAAPDAASPTPEPSTTSPAPTGPVIRWAAVVWGLAFSALAAVLLWIVTDVTRRDDVSTWLETLTPGTFVLYAVLALGALLLVAGVAGILRRTTRPRG
ncbi:hypothetical protein [Leifsonia sp. Leaf264]|uniref:hypothetical protein n=1 Tax=Leifsonia sp. Leaf264 TaxID=1736314 RepID=UPI0006FAA3AD|nr:hypothetical protein [Leifsonia sp. Leaf264]KQO96797.1 hypothetical protein ASF30_17060 [Leifsonia sp. Leaf264]